MENGNAFAWIIDRLKEPSTWAGIAGLLGAAGFVFSAEMSQAVTTAGIAFASLIAVVIHEKSK